MNEYPEETYEEQPYYTAHDKIYPRRKRRPCPRPTPNPIRTILLFDHIELRLSHETGAVFIQCPSEVKSALISLCHLENQHWPRQACILRSSVGSEIIYFVSFSELPPGSWKSMICALPLHNHEYIRVVADDVTMLDWRT